MITNSGIKVGSKQAKLIEFGLLHGIALCAGDEFPPIYLILMMSGRSVLDEI